MVRRLLCLAAIALGMMFPGILRAADGDNETVSFSTPSKVGAVVVPAGLYRLKLQGSVLFLTETETKKAYSTLVRVEKTGKKSAFTAALGKTVDGSTQVEAIVIQGADYKLVF